MTRMLTAACAILATSWLIGCGSGDQGSEGDVAAQTGSIGLALSAVGPSGAEYRLRNAEFDLWNYSRDCWDEEDCEETEQTISSEDYLDQPSITLDLLKGEYQISLQNGWQLEKIVDGESEVVEAQLLSSRSQYVYVQPYQTRWVNYKFGVGDEELWFTGQLQIDMQVYEDPEDYYGGDCTIYREDGYCWEECCTEECDPDGGCWGGCSVDEVPCEDGGSAGAPNG